MTCQHGWTTDSVQWPSDLTHIANHCGILPLQTVQCEVIKLNAWLFLSQCQLRMADATVLDLMH